MQSVIEYPTGIQLPEVHRSIWLAGGCFWGTEEYFSGVSGVLATAVGYANGNTEHPTYEAVCTGTTGFAETVYLAYDPDVVSLSFLLTLYYKSINPLSLNRQGGDRGTQYRTGIYYNREEDLPVIEESIAQLEKQLGESTAIERVPLANFYLAEEYHQKYLKKNPGGYCHIPASLFSYAQSAKEYPRQSPEELAARLTPLQYHVTQEEGTEPPFANAYDSEFRKGIYVDITTGEPLFRSSDKFQAGCGWPAFSRPIHNALLTERLDTTYNRLRTEVRSAAGDAHLGHVFEDGPEELGGMRYCINSAALRFVPWEDMEQEGYGDYKKLLEED